VAYVHTVTRVKDSTVTAVVHTRLVHDTHRRASSVLAEAAADPAASVAALAELRDFLVAHLDDHHTSEDNILWPMIENRDPGAAEPLARLSAEHDQLEAALEALAAAPIDEPGRTALVNSAVAVRDLVHAHLDHEEPILFAALREHVSEEEWEDFARQVRATAPDVGTHLLVGLLEQVGTPEEVEIILRDVPAPVRAALREQAQESLGRLTAAG